MLPDVKHAHAALIAALEMLREAQIPGQNPEGTVAPLPGLLAECEALCAEISAAEPEPIRTIHHLACSGGTLISKIVAALPAVVLLSEIDPLSNMGFSPKKPRFAPTDVILGLRYASRPVPDRIIVETFRASIAALHDSLTLSGQRLVLRDHAHSQFCTEVDAAARLSLHEMLVGLRPIRSLVTVRHPLDCFLALDHNDWRYFSPFTLEEYACRVSTFLSRHQGIPMVRYEDVVASPEECLRRICGILHLPFEPLAPDLIGAIRMSGDSGRTDTVIGTRPRRQIPAEIEAQRDVESYHALCRQLGYEP